MHLTTDDVERLHRASALMLRPFNFSGQMEFLLAATRAIRPLLGSHAAICGCLTSTGEVRVASEDYSKPDVDGFARWKLADSGMERALAGGHEVVSMRRLVAGDWDILEQDPMVNEWYYPHDVHDVIGMLVTWPEDGAYSLAEFHHDRFGTRRMGEDGEALLYLLLPSFRAGNRLLYSLGQHRLRLASDLEALGISLCVCSHDGRLSHVAASTLALLDRDPERDIVLKRVGAVAREVAMSVRRPAGERPDHLPQSHELVETAFARYRLSGALATHEMQFGAADILVTVARLTAVPPSAEQLRTKFGLTQRECEVALRLSRGERNATIASALGVSGHTVRRHTERILAKLGVSNRAEASAKLLG